MKSIKTLLVIALLSLASCSTDESTEKIPPVGIDPTLQEMVDDCVKQHLTTSQLKSPPPGITPLCDCITIAIDSSKVK